MPPTSLHLGALSVQQNATALSDVLEVQPIEDRAVGLNPSSIASGTTIFESTFVESIIWENYAANSLRFTKFVNGTDIVVILCL